MEDCIRKRGIMRYELDIVSPELLGIGYRPVCDCDLQARKKLKPEKCTLRRM